MYKLDINVSSNYQIIIDDKINVEQYIKELYSNKNIFLIVDEVVYNLYKEKIKNDFINYKTFIVTVKALEQNKVLKTYDYIINELLEKNITRDSLLVGIGGGIIGDISAFIASTLLRGIKYISIPTTLLSQVDSSIGGKTGLNFNNVKNVIGTFYQPSLVLIDTSYLSTLSIDEYNNGLAEVIKCGLIYDKEIISLLKDKYDIINIIYKSLQAKKHYVEKDEYDLTDRMILNFGHTFGHIVELEKKIKHGFAVVEGMIMAIEFGIDSGDTDPSIKKELLRLLQLLNIEYQHLNYKDYLSKITTDKKNSEEYNTFILLKDINQPIIKKVKRG